MTSSSSMKGSELHASYKRSSMVAELGDEPLNEDDRRIASCLSTGSSGMVSLTLKQVYTIAYAMMDRVLESEDLKYCSAVQEAIDEKIQNHFQIIEKLLDKCAGDSPAKTQMFNERRAEKLALKEFQGKNDRSGYRVYADAVKNWAGALYKDGIKHLEEAEKSDINIDDYVREQAKPEEV